MNNSQQTWSTPVVEERREAIPCALCGGTEFRPYMACKGYAYVKCERCGLVQMNPQPESSAVHSRYNGDAYFNYEIANERAFLRLGRLGLFDANLPYLEDAADAVGNRRVLEVGCATGGLLEFLSWRGWETQGVEISAREAEYAKEHRHLNVSTLPLEDNHFPDGYFFMVVASHLIEHLNDPGAFVREVYRVLASGGRFLVTTPNISGFQARLFRSGWRSAIFDHLYLFSKETLSRLLLKEGFHVEKIVTWGGIAEGYGPKLLKRVLDIGAKMCGFGDVMLIRAEKAPALSGAFKK